MNSYKFNQWFDLDHINIFCCKMSIAELATVLYLIFFVGIVSADLSTTPPHVIPKIHKEQSQTDGIVAKARKAISKNRLTSPEGNNALFYAKQLLALSPKDKDALSILNEISDKYIALGYKRLRKYQLNLAQKHHNKASMIARQFNIDFDSQKLAKLQQEITTTRQQISQLKSKLKKHIKANKLLKKIKHEVKERHFITDKIQPPEKVIQTKLLVIQKVSQNNQETTLLPQHRSEELLGLTQNVFQEQYPSAVKQYYKKGGVRNKFTHIPETMVDVSQKRGSLAIVTAGKTEDHHDTMKFFQLQRVKWFL